MGEAKRGAEAFERVVKQIDANIKAVDEATTAHKAGRETPDTVIDLIGRSHRLIADCAGRGRTRDGWRSWSHASTAPRASQSGTSSSRCCCAICSPR